MQYRTLKKNGDKISILGFGCMRLVQRFGRIDEKRATRQIHYAIDNGVNYFDTAMPYHMGASEPFLGRALSNGLRQKVKVATKINALSVKKHEDMDGILTGQLGKLQTDHIDYYLLHMLDRSNWKKFHDLDVLTFLDRAKKEGLIINAGFSFHGDREIFKEIVDAYDWDMCQIQYNILDETNQAGKEGLKYAAEKGLGVIIMEPLRGGSLTLRIPPPVASIWSEGPLFGSPAEGALRWVWNHPEVTCVLSGMNEEKHIEENIRIASQALPNSLTEEELSLINRARDKFRELQKVDCTGCRYCMPCPSGVDIPTSFEVYNTYHMFGRRIMDKGQGYGRLAGIEGDPCFPSLCTECRECTKKCPQHLNIPVLLKGVSKDFEGRIMKIMFWLFKKFFGWQTRSIRKRASRMEEERHTTPCGH
jgi:hypothetical protein